MTSFSGKRFGLVLTLIALLVAAIFCNWRPAQPSSASSLVGSALASPPTNHSYVPPAIPAATAVTHTIIFVGDSLTVGFYATDPSHRYATRVAAMEGKSYAVQSQYGARAADTAATMRNIPAGTPAVPPDAQYAIIELGTNDVVSTSETLADFQADYDYILTRVHTDAPSAKILCLGTWRDGTQGVQNSGYSYNQIIESDCARLVGGTYLGLSALYNTSGYHGPAGNPTYYGGADWFHPNSAGHQAIANLVTTVIP